MSGNINSPQMALPLAHPDKASFDNFWLGRNTELVAALKRLSEQNRPSAASIKQATASIDQAASRTNHKMVYVYGAPSAGKSHLLFSTIRATKSAGESRHSSYLSLSDTRVALEMLSVINVDGLVCIDDIHAWAGDQQKERALFTLFEQIKHAGGRLLVSATQPPNAAGFVINDLISRLASGLLYPVYELDDDERFYAIKLRADQRGLKIADDAVKYLLSRSSRDMRELSDVLERIDKTSLAEQRRITIPFLQSLLRS